ncbi:hypothetical protein [Methanolapillus millepedarum]|uniref:hypothetical protein n=1 Tax=Methanolapillus millepedarum TaxID=3028296 RepID=UPI0030B8D11D
MQLAPGVFYFPTASATTIPNSFHGSPFNQTLLRLIKRDGLLEIKKSNEFKIEIEIKKSNEFKIEIEIKKSNEFKIEIEIKKSNEFKIEIENKN